MKQKENVSNNSNFMELAAELQLMFSPMPECEIKLIRQRLPLVWEIYDIACERGKGNTYFLNFDHPWNDIKHKFWKGVESDLGVLDDKAWELLKAEAAHRFSKKRDLKRGWQTALDIVNEAKAYRFLKEELGFTELQFIPRATVNGKKTPDLQGKRNDKSVLCEVKTINPSKEETDARTNIAARSIQQFLQEGFWTKLRATIQSANVQMTDYGDSASVSRIVYVIINFDDSLHTHASHYIKQIKDQAPNLCLPEVEVIFDIESPYYSATSISPPSTILYCSTKGCALYR